jgi:hypothetical protein
MSLPWNTTAPLLNRSTQTKPTEQVKTHQQQIAIGGEQAISFSQDMVWSLAKIQSMRQEHQIKAVPAQRQLRRITDHISADTGTLGINHKGPHDARALEQGLIRGNLPNLHRAKTEHLWQHQIKTLLCMAQQSLPHCPLIPLT